MSTRSAGYQTWRAPGGLRELRLPVLEEQRRRASRKRAEILRLMIDSGYTRREISRKSLEELLRLIEAARAEARSSYEIITVDGERILRVKLRWTVEKHSG
jgi:hypothetical protein